MQTRRNTPWIVLVPVLVILVALVAWALQKQREPTSAVDAPAVVASPPPTAAMPGPAAALALGSHPGSGSGPLAPFSPSRGNREKMLAERDRQMAAMEQSHRAEAVDPAWAGRASAQLDAIATSEALQSSGIKPGNYDADCRSATCRVSARFKSAGDAEDWGTFYLASSGETIRQARMTVIQGADGSAEVRIYGARR